MSNNDSIRRELGHDLIRAELSARALRVAGRRDEADAVTQRKREHGAPTGGQRSGGWVVFEPEEVPYLKPAVNTPA